MDNSLQILCDAIKKVLLRLKPQSNPLSFVLVIGKPNQGKSALLKQSQMEAIPVVGEHQTTIYFNQNGIMLELNDGWFNSRYSLVQHTLKQLNKCNKYLKITGLILCVDVNDLLVSDSQQFAEHKQSHLQTLERISANLGYATELAIVFTKMDSLSGFLEFYQSAHVTELAKPLGFSLECINKKNLKMTTYNQHFNHLIELIGQEVINKMHPARSTIKRSLIREFPLQLASLRAPIQALIQAIPNALLNIHSIYFTSAEQGGLSVDRLNNKIKHEYALVVQDTFPQAVNYRSYFIEGALKTIQQQCKQLINPKKFNQNYTIAITLSMTCLSLILLCYNHFKAAHLLDDASKELFSYAISNNQGNAQALYHLSKAAHSLEHMHANALSLPQVQQLKLKVQQSAQHHLQADFLPSLTHELEAVITNPSNTPIRRYNALKVYLMLDKTTHFSAQAVEQWFAEHWSALDSDTLEKKVALLKQILKNPLQGIATKPQIIKDARNYLNALPTSYLYYSLAKEYFDPKEQKIAIEGFSLAASQVPLYFTKAGFQKTMQDIPRISRLLRTENWVLARQDLTALEALLTEAYCFNYTTWWRTFLQKSQPLHYQDYQQGRQLATLLNQSGGMSHLIAYVQEQTQPDLKQSNSVFNQLVANQFTDLNLLSLSSLKELNVKISELEQFLSTLSVVHDGGRTAFNITKTRFINEISSDPISLLFNQSKQFPEPLKSWTNKLAGDAWFLLIQDSRQYINTQWQQLVYTEFQSTIAQRYPFVSGQKNEITINDFNHFFSTHGVLNSFTEQYIKPFIDTSSAQWKTKVVNDMVLPLSTETLDEIIRANIITNMFYPEHGDVSTIRFSLQKISLDPVVSKLRLEIGDSKLVDNQESNSFIQFNWPQSDAKLALDSIEGNHYELAEQGTWALFKLLEKVNVLVDEQDGSSLQILFEVNGNSGRYLLKTTNKVNPFTPGILNGFSLNEVLV